MADEQATELVRELRRIRYVLVRILLLLALDFAQEGIHHWTESHYQTPRMAQEEFHDTAPSCGPCTAS
jgi:hypothetical protein